MVLIHICIDFLTGLQYFLTKIKIRKNGYNFDYQLFINVKIRAKAINTRILNIGVILGYSWLEKKNSRANGLGIFLLIAIPIDLTIASPLNLFLMRDHFLGIPLFSYRPQFGRNGNLQYWSIDYHQL